MNNLDWGSWFRGLIQAVVSGVITALTAIIVLPERPAAWTLFVIAGAPVILGFLGYVKQSPPPIGYKLVREEIVSQVTKMVDIPEKKGG